MASVNNVVNPFLAPSIVPLPHNVKDSRWLTLEVCREYQRNKCSRTENECKFAHPPAHVEVQNGRVVCCFDSLKGKCQRKDPPCKYLHPPNHLREFLMQNGRNNLIMKNLQMQFLQNSIFAPSSPSGVIPISALDAGAQGATPSTAKLLIPGAPNTGISPGLQASYSLLPYLQPPHPGGSPAAAAGPPAPGNPYQQLLGGATLPASALIAASHDPTNLMNASMAAAAMAGLPSAAQAAVNGVVVSSAGHLNGTSPTATVTTMSASLPSMAAVSVASKSTPRSSDARIDTAQEMLLKAKKRCLEEESTAVSAAAPSATPAFLQLGLGIPAAYPGLTAKRPAVADSKSGLPVYQPQGLTGGAAAAAAAAAAAYPGLTTMQLPGGQHAFIPTVPTSTFVGHTASLPRF